MVGPGGAVPGWYPDPSGDYEHRWWDGASWTDRAATGSFVADDPVVPPSPLPAEEAVLWHSGGDMLTTHRVIIASTLPNYPPEQFEAWMVAGVRARHSGVGDVEITIAFSGYGGRATWLFRGVQDPPAVAALVRKQANRVRVALQLGASSGPGGYGTPGGYGAAASQAPPPHRQYGITP